MHWKQNTLTKQIAAKIELIMSKFSSTKSISQVNRIKKKKNWGRSTKSGHLYSQHRQFFNCSPLKIRNSSRKEWDAIVGVETVRFRAYGAEWHEKLVGELSLSINEGSHFFDKLCTPDYCVSVISWFDKQLNFLEVLK